MQRYFQLFGVVALFVTMLAGSTLDRPVVQAVNVADTAQSDGLTLFFPMVFSAETNQGPPQIEVFRAEPNTIRAGEASSLSWTVRGATSLRIEPGIGPVTASVQVRPDTTTTYTLIAQNANGESRATTTVTIGEQAAPISGAILFGNDSLRSSDIETDGKGGMHVVFSKIPPVGEGEVQATFYAYCATASTCNSGEGWKITAIPQIEQFPWVQLKLTPQGQPRLLLMRTIYPDNGSISGGKQYVYAECDTNCTQSENWRLINVINSNSGGGLYDSDYSYRTFDLDHLGRPRFIYEDRANNSGDHTGAYYVYCNENCSEPGTWTEIRLEAHNVNVYIDEKSVLAFTPDGKARVLGTDGGIPTRLLYLECSATCTQSSDWSVPLHMYDIVTGSGYRGWSMDFDPNGRPRIAFYPGGGPLQYAWCEQDCRQPQNWDEVQIPTANNASGEHPALVIDQQGRPRIAFRDQDKYGLGYAFCNENCQSAEGKWSVGLVEDDGQLDQEFPIKPLPNCDTSTWFGGLRNQLSLDAEGNPRISYDAELMMRCKRYPNDPNNGQTFVEAKWWTVRVIYFPQP